MRPPVAPGPVSGFPRPLDRVARYTARRAATPPALDGRADAECWRHAERTARFVDLVGGDPVPLDTTASMVWDDEHLFVAFRLEEPDVTGTLTERDSHVWLDDDVELFIAGPDGYYELEVNALNTVYEVLFAWGEHPGGAPFDGVGFRHPRGARTGFWDFDLAGLRTAVHVDGTLNDPAHRDRGWSVEIAVPWSSLSVLAGGRPLPPQDGDEWRIALMRFNTERDGTATGWSWSPHGVWDAHVPELFPVVRFSTGPAASPDPVGRTEPARRTDPTR